MELVITPLSTEAVAAVAQVLLKAVTRAGGDHGFEGEDGKALRRQRDLLQRAHEVLKAARWLATDEGLAALGAQLRAMLAVEEYRIEVEDDDEEEEGEEKEREEKEEEDEQEDEPEDDNLVSVQRSLTVTGAVERMYQQSDLVSVGERFNRFIESSPGLLVYVTVVLMAVVDIGPALMGGRSTFVGLDLSLGSSYAHTPGLHWLLVAGAVAGALTILYTVAAVIEAKTSMIHYHGRALVGTVTFSQWLSGNRVRAQKDARKRPGQVTPRTSLLLLCLRVALMSAALAVNWLNIAPNDDFTFGPLGDAISGVYMLGEVLLAGYAAATSPLSWALASDFEYYAPYVDFTLDAVAPLASLCPYVLPTGVTWSEHPFAGQLLLSPLSVLLVPVFAALQWLPVGVMFGLISIFSATARKAVQESDAHWLIKWPVILFVVLPLGLLPGVFVVLLGLLGCVGGFICLGIVLPVLLVFIGPSMISAGSFAQGIASASLCLNILVTHLTDSGVGVLLLGLDASKTAQLAVLYTILAGWCGYLLLQQVSHGLTTLAALHSAEFRAGQSCLLKAAVGTYEVLLLLAGLPTLLASSMVWLPDEGRVVRAFSWLVGVDAHAVKAAAVAVSAPPPGPHDQADDNPTSSYGEPLQLEDWQQAGAIDL